MPVNRNVNMNHEGNVDAIISEEHVHNTEIWIPTAVDTSTIPSGLTLISSGPPNSGSFGNWVQVVAATSSTKWSDYHRILIVSASADEEYEIEIGIGGVGSEVGITRVHVVYDSSGGLSLRIPANMICPLIPPSTRVVARVRNATANQRTITIRLGYHEYPEDVIPV